MYWTYYVSAGFGAAVLYLCTFPPCNQSVNERFSRGISVPLCPMNDLSALVSSQVIPEKRRKCKGEIGEGLIWKSGVAIGRENKQSMREATRAQYTLQRTGSRGGKFEPSIGAHSIMGQTHSLPIYAKKCEAVERLFEAQWTVSKPGDF